MLKSFTWIMPPTPHHHWTLQSFESCTSFHQLDTCKLYQETDTRYLPIISRHLMYLILVSSISTKVWLFEAPADVAINFDNYQHFKRISWISSCCSALIPKYKYKNEKTYKSKWKYKFTKMAVNRLLHEAQQFKVIPGCLKRSYNVMDGSWGTFARMSH